MESNVDSSECPLWGTFKIELHDNTTPTVTSVSVPSGMSFQYGQSVPIIVTFSEPVDLTDVKLDTANSVTLAPVEIGSKGIRQTTFLYPVHSVDQSSSLSTIDVTGAVALSKNAQTTITKKTDHLTDDVMTGTSKYY